MGECEKKIKEYLKRNNGKKLGELEKGLVLFEECYESILKASKIASILYMGKSDLLCFNKNDGAIVVIEIKCSTAMHHTFGQILYYLDGVEDIKCANLAKLNKQNVEKVRGIILAKKIDKSLERLLIKYSNFIPEISLITYTQEEDGNFSFDVRLPLDC